jgi:hypothetical protein
LKILSLIFSNCEAVLSNANFINLKLLRMNNTG